MSAVRLRRLKADYDRLSEYVRRHPRLKLIQVEGDPPERYQLEMQIKSIRMTGGELQSVQSHLVEIALPLAYPRTPPQCRMLSPVFHPNIAPHAICVGDHWGAGESLQSIVARIGEMLAYQSYNVKSPLNGEAARWVEDNKDRLPLDRVSLLVEDGGAATTADAAVGTASPPSNSPAPKMQVAPPVSPCPPAPASFGASEPSKPLTVETPAPIVEDETVATACPECGAGYRISAEAVGRRLRCRKCLQVFVASAK